MTSSKDHAGPQFQDTEATPEELKSVALLGIVVLLVVALLTGVITLGIARLLI